MATISCTSFWSRWDAKQYIFAGLVGALVTMAVVAVISISLAPAHIFFSVENATTTSNVSAGDGFYNFTLVSNNTSWHTKAHFASLSAQIWYSSTGYIMAEDVNTTAVMPWWLSPRKGTNVAFCADYAQYDEKPQQGNKSAPAPSSMQPDDEEATIQDCHVVVMAKVRFKSVYGLLDTVPYTIQVTCFHVNFSNTDATVNCS